MDRKKKSNEQKIIWSRILIILVIVISIVLISYWIYQKTVEEVDSEELELDQGEVNLDLRSLDLKERVLVEDDGLIEFDEEEREKCYALPPNYCEGDEECIGAYDASCITKLRKGNEWCNLIEDKEMKIICKETRVDSPNESMDLLEQQFIQDSLDINILKIDGRLLEEK
jgi:hypothetical protein